MKDQPSSSGVSVHDAAAQAHSLSSGWNHIRLQLGLHHAEDKAEAIEALKRVGAEELQADPASIEVKDGWVQVMQLRVCRIIRRRPCYESLDSCCLQIKGGMLGKISVHDAAAMAHHSETGWEHIRRQLGVHKDTHHSNMNRLLLEVGAEVLKCDASQLEIHQGWVRVKGGLGAQMPVHAVAEQAHATATGWKHVRDALAIHHEDRSEDSDDDRDVHAGASVSRTSRETMCAY